MKKQTTKAIKLLALAVFLAIVPACEMSPVAVNQNGNNTAVVEPASNANTNSANESNMVEPASNANSANESTTVESVANENSDSKPETKIEEKLAPKNLGVWKGKALNGKDLTFDFRGDGTVTSSLDERPGKYEVIDENTAEIVTPESPPQTWKISIKDDKMTITTPRGAFVLTKTN